MKKINECNEYKEFKEFISTLGLDEERKITALCVIDFCEKRRFEEASKIVMSICDENIPNLYQVMYKLLELYPIDSMLYEFCKVLQFIVKQLISFKRYKIYSDLQSNLNNIACQHYRFSNGSLYHFAQTLELLFAFGYTDLGVIIYCLYQQINEDSIYQLTELTLSKKLSCVYIIDHDNKRKVAKECNRIKNYLIESSRFDLQGLCYYYLGIAEEFDVFVFKRKKVIEDCIMCGSSGYMEKSKKIGFLLAKKYIHHHEQKNFVTSQIDYKCRINEGCDELIEIHQDV